MGAEERETVVKSEGPGDAGVAVMHSICWRTNMGNKEVHSSPEPIGSASPEASKGPFECTY